MYIEAIFRIALFWSYRVLLVHSLTPLCMVFCWDHRVFTYLWSHLLTVGLPSVSPDWNVLFLAFAWKRALTASLLWGPLAAFYTAIRYNGRARVVFCTGGKIQTSACWRSRWTVSVRKNLSPHAAALERVSTWLQMIVFMLVKPPVYKISTTERYFNGNLHFRRRRWACTGSRCRQDGRHKFPCR